MAEVTISVLGNQLAMAFDYNIINVEKIKSMPQRRWNKSKNVWEFKPTLVNIQYAKKWFPEAEWDLDTDELVEQAFERKEKRDAIGELKESGEFDFSLLDDTIFKLPPLEHQKKALLLGRDMPYFAYIMDQGTGKTKVLLDDAAYNYRQGNIEALIVVAPNSVKTNWWDPEQTYLKTKNPDDMDEITKHMAPDIEYNAGCWVSSPKKIEREIYDKFARKIGDENVLQILVVNVEALHVKRVYEECLNVMTLRKCMIVCDESTRIKNRTAKRTKNATKLRGYCTHARIMSGTPLIKSPLDAFAQFKFLHPDVLGYDNFYSFRNRYATMGGFNGFQVLYYNNLDELSDAIDKVSFRVLKKDCLDLPPKKYIKRKIDLTTEQRSMYQDMLKLSKVELSDYQNVTATIVLTKLLRLQQIAGGYLPELDKAGETIGVVEIMPPNNNPKFKEVLQLIEESGDQKVIIWCRFRAEIAGLVSLLEQQKITFVEFHGGIAQRDRRKIRKDFYSDSHIKVLLANQDTGGVGIDDFKVASIVIYLSNSFSTEGRIQSEDRTHRIGSEVHDLISYYDLEAQKTVDSKVISCLRNNLEISAMIMKDGWEGWVS